MKKIGIIFLIFLTTSIFATTLNSNTGHVKVAAVLFPELAGQSEHEFIKMVGRYIDKAQKNQVKIILFPELITLNLLNKSDHPTPQQLRKIVRYSSSYRHFLKSKAMSSGMIIIGGTTVTEKNNKFYNTAIVAMPNGEVKTVDKSLLTPWELSNHITGVGKAEPLSFQTPWGTAVILICYEAESAEMVSKLSKFNPNLVFIPSNTNGLHGLERVTVAAKYIAIGQFAYTLLTGVATNLPKENVANNSAGQAIFATPEQSGYPLDAKLGKFNRPDLFIVDANIDKIKQDKISPQSTFAARDYDREQ